MARALWFGLSLLPGYAAAAAGGATCRGAATCGGPAVDEEASLLQVGGAKAPVALMQDGRQGNPLARIAIKNGKFMQGEEEVVLFGGNYVYKQHPYFPEPSQVTADAIRIRDDLASSPYDPQPDANGNPRKKVPHVRLGALFEGMMPEKAGEIDTLWLDKLKATIQAFAQEGVYVILDAHSDAWSTTNGGEGFPWWMSAWMQEHAHHGESYIVSPEHPLANALPDFLVNLLNGAGIGFPEIKTVEGDDNPWYNFSVGSGMNPARMNIGNPSIRLNNNDAAWDAGSLRFTKQVQNSMYRFLNSHKNRGDKEALFMPFVQFVQELSTLWEDYSNVIAVELLNEPVPSGLPDLKKVAESRFDLWMFYAKVFHELEKSGGPLAPMAIEDLGGSVPGVNQLYDAILNSQADLCDHWSMAKLRQWAEAGRLIISFHYYPGNNGGLPLADFVGLGVQFANKFPGTAVWLSEFMSATSEEMALTCRDAAEAGAGAVTWWHYVATDFTEQEGWFIYPTEVGTPISKDGVIDWAVWPKYLETVIDGTFYGAMLTGSTNGKYDVLGKIPAREPASKMAKAQSKKVKAQARRFPNVF